jgi:hypothetical protein
MYITTSSSKFAHELSLEYRARTMPGEKRGAGVKNIFLEVITAYTDDFKIEGV